MFRGITMEQRLERKAWVGGDEREGGCSKENWRESSVSRVLLVKRDSLKSLSTVVYFLAIPRPSRTIVRSTPSSHVHKRERTKGWKKMEEEHRNGWPDSFSTGTFLPVVASSPFPPRDEVIGRGNTRSWIGLPAGSLPPFSFSSYRGHP